MAKILVAGHINIETTIQIDGFPIEYTPVRYLFNGVNSTVSGVGLNISKALNTLGHTVDFHSIVGDDVAGDLVRQELQSNNIATDNVLSLMPKTCQSAILYAPDGTRMINTDLKNIQETAYPLEYLNFEDVSLAVLCNINYTRPMLEQAKQANIAIVTDVHTISNLHDDYNSDYMAAATILFQSAERLPVMSEKWIQQLWAEYETPIAVVGMGARGALVGVRADKQILYVEARALRPIKNTIGSGDSLLSGFVHSYAQTQDPYVSLQKAVLFAGYKIGSVGAAEGFMTVDELESVCRQYYPNV